MAYSIEKGQEEKERQEVIGAAGVFVVKETKTSAEFLLVRRLGKLEHDRLSPPGGREEGEEDSIGCVARELEEETGLLVKAEDLVFIYLGTQDFTKTGAAFRYRGYLVVWRAGMGEPQRKEPEEHGEWEWINEREMDGLADDDQLSAAADLMWKAYRRYKEFLLKRKLGPDLDEGFEPMKEDVEIARVLAEEGRLELPGERELLSRVAKMYFD